MPFAKIGPESRRNLFVLVLMFAFLMQSCITQTHIHGVAPVVGGSGTVKVLAKIPGSGNANGSSAADCPFCQAIIHASAFFAPAPPLLLLPALQVESVTLFRSLSLAMAGAAHNWRSRAPPLR